MRRGRNFLKIFVFLFFLTGCNGKETSLPSCLENILIQVYAEPVSGYVPLSVNIRVEISSPEPISRAFLDLYFSGGDTPERTEEITIEKEYVFSEQITYYYKNTYRPRVKLRYFDKCEITQFGPFIDVGIKILPECTSTTGPSFLFLHYGGYYSVTTNDFTGSVTLYEWQIDLGNDGVFDKTITSTTSTIELIPVRDINRLGLNSLNPFIYTSSGEKIACPRKGIIVGVEGEYILGTRYSGGDEIAVPFLLGGNVVDSGLFSHPSSPTYIAFSTNTGIGVIDASEVNNPILKGMLIESYCYSSPEHTTVCEKYDSLSKIYFDPATYSCIYAGIKEPSFGNYMIPMRLYSLSPENGLRRIQNFSELTGIKDFDLYYEDSLTATLIGACDIYGKFVVFFAQCSSGGITALGPYSLGYECHNISWVKNLQGEFYAGILTRQIGPYYSLGRCEYIFGNSPQCEFYNESVTVQGRILAIDAEFINPSTYIAILRDNYEIEIYKNDGTFPQKITSFYDSCSGNSSFLPRLEFSDSYLFARSRGFYVYSLTDPSNPVELTHTCGVFSGALTDGLNLFLLYSDRLEIMDFGEFLTSGTQSFRVRYYPYPQKGNFIYLADKMLVSSANHGVLEMDMGPLFSGYNYVRFSRSYDPRDDKKSNLYFRDIYPKDSTSVFLATSEGIKEFYPSGNTFFTKIPGDFSIVRYDGNNLLTVKTDGTVELWENYININPTCTQNIPNIKAVDIKSGTAYAGAGTNLYLFSLTDCSLRSIPLYAEIKDLKVSGNYLFISLKSNSALRIYDISQPLNPSFQGSGSYYSSDSIYSSYVNYLSVDDGKVVVLGIDPGAQVKSGFSIFRTIFPQFPEYGGTAQEVGTGNTIHVNIVQKNIRGYSYLLTIMNDWIYFYLLGSME